MNAKYFHEVIVNWNQLKKRLPAMSTSQGTRPDYVSLKHAPTQPHFRCGSLWISTKELMPLHLLFN
jgi:hypothetical protein